MKQKTKKKLLVTIEIISIIAFVAFFVCVMLFMPNTYAELVAQAAHAEEIEATPETETPETETPSEPIVIIKDKEDSVADEFKNNILPYVVSAGGVKDKEDSIADVFKNNILPYVVSAGGAILAVLTTLIPYIKLRGKNKSLQGMYTVMNKTLEAYKAKEGEFNVENFVNAIQNNVVEELKKFIESTVKQVVESNVIDNTEALNAIKVSTDLLQAQIGGITNAALQVWGESPEARKFLTETPVPKVLEEYYKKFTELKAKLEEKQASEVSELNAVVEELGVYDHEHE